jgi:hypothetical protein
MKANFLIIGLLAVISFGAHAESHIFSKTQKVIRTEYPCLWRTKLCDLDQMGADLIEECTNSGYDNCTVIRAEAPTTRVNRYGICGITTSFMCQVQVKGNK